MCQKLEVDQRYVIKFCSGEYVPLLEIVQRLREPYGEGVLSQLQVYYWINEVKLERTDLAKIVSQGRGPDGCSATVVSNKIDSDPHLSA
jgi:hypothetical protein